LSRFVPDGPPDYGLDRAALSATPHDAHYAVLLHATAQREKEWPIEHWVALGQSLLARNIRPVLPWGNARERDRSRAIAAALPGADVPDFQPLDGVARLIAGASLVVGVDTGLLHLAAALNVPLAGIFIGSEPALTGPMGRVRSSCSGAGAKCRPAHVMAALDRLL
jgi:heptosyltransferase-1